MNKSSKRGRKPLLFFLIFFGVLLVMLIAFTLWLPSFVMTGKRQTLAEALDWQSNHYDTSFYQKLAKADYTVAGENGYTLHVEYLKNPSESTKYIILSHGYTDNRIGSLKYVPMYLELGFNCIIYDLRGHGENEPHITTYGVLEGVDLDLLIRDTSVRYPDLTVLGLHGESLGAATTITALKYKPEVDFVVADCGFSDIENVLKHGYRNAHMPELLFELTDIGARLRYHYSLKAMRPIESLAGNKIPILFIHGAKDSLILPQNSEEMAEKTQGYRELFFLPGAGHAESILTDRAQYQEYVAIFLKGLGIEDFDSSASPRRNK